MIVIVLCMQEQHDLFYTFVRYSQVSLRKVTNSSVVKCLKVTIAHCVDVAKQARAASSSDAEESTSFLFALDNVKYILPNNNRYVCTYSILLYFALLTCISVL